jgi:hypothetical protein
MGLMQPEQYFALACAPGGSKVLHPSEPYVCQQDLVLLADELVANLPRPDGGYYVRQMEFAGDI